MKDTTGALILQGLVGLMSLVVLIPICGLLYRISRERPWVTALSVAMCIAFMAAFFFFGVK